MDHGHGRRPGTDDGTSISPSRPSFVRHRHCNGVSTMLLPLHCCTTIVIVRCPLTPPLVPSAIGASSIIILSCIISIKIISFSSHKCERLSTSTSIASIRNHLLMTANYDSYNNCNKSDDYMETTTNSFRSSDTWIRQL